MHVTTPPLAASQSYDIDSGIDVVFQLSGYILGDSIRVHSNYSVAAAIPTRAQNAEQGTQQARFIAPEIGFHGVFASSTVRIDNQQIEYIAQYPQYASQVLMTTESSDKIQMSPLAFMEHRGGHNNCVGSNALVDSDGTHDIVGHKSFAVKPLCVLSHMPIIDAKTRYITLTLRLNNNKAFVVKQNGGSDIKIILDSLYISYETVSDALGKKLLTDTKDLTYPIVSTQLLSIKSNQEYLSLNLPAVGNVIGWVATSVPVYDPTYGNYNQFRTMAIPNLTRMRLTLNGRDINQTFPMVTYAPGNDQQLEIMKAHKVLQLAGLTQKATAFGTSDREFYYKLDGVYSDAYPPSGIAFDNSSTLGFEINSDVQNGVLYGAKQYQFYLSLISRATV